jgi:hypothetical protein
MTTNLTMQVRNRPKLTMQALTSLEQRGDMNITVLDDRSDYDTRGLVERWCAEHWARYVRNDTPMGTGQLRNLVIAESEKFWGRGDYLAPHDNDVFFHPHWLDKIIGCYVEAWDQGFRLMGAYAHPFHLPWGDFVEMKTRLGYHVYRVQALPTQSQFMRWDVWDQFGPFCDTPIDKVCQSEDVDFSRRFTAADAKIGVVFPHVVNATAFTNTFGEKIPGWNLVQAACPKDLVCE